MLEDAGAPVLLTQRVAGSTACRRSRAAIVRLDADWPTIGATAEPPRRSARPGRHNLAYVIYTSGSTGRPRASWSSTRSVATAR